MNTDIMAFNNAVSYAQVAATYIKSVEAYWTNDGEIIWDFVQICAPPTNEPGYVPEKINVENDDITPLKRRYLSPREQFLYKREFNRLARTTNVRPGDRWLEYIGKRGTYETSGKLRKKTRKLLREKQYVIPRDDIPRGIVRPTSQKQIKKRTPLCAFEKENAQHYPVGVIISPPPPKIVRNEMLARRIRGKILLLKSRRLPGKYRMLTFVKYMRWLEQNQEKAEVQGMFDVGLTKTARDYLDNAIQTIVSSVKDVVDATTNKTAINFTAVAGILLTAAAGHTRASWITGILASLAVTGVINYDTVVGAGGLFASAAAKKPESSSGTTGTGQADDPLQALEEQQTDTTVSAGLTLLFQGIGTYCGITDDMDKREGTIKDWAQIITKNLQFNARSTTGLFSFFRHFIYLIRKMVKWVYCRLNPGADKIIAFWEHSAVVREIVTECNNLIALNAVDFADSNNMARLTAAITILTEVIVRVGSFDQHSNGIALLNYFINVKSKLLKKQEECHKLGYSAVTKPTPYCVYIVGDPGIGKSTILNNIAQDLGPFCGVNEKVAGKVYKREPAQKFWDGYINEEIVVYDDFAQIDGPDPTHSDVAELFSLITDQPFRPNMADVNDKGRIADIKLVLIASNQAFPERTWLSHQDALWRRRNYLLRAELVASLPKKNDLFDAKFEHLRFKVYESYLDKTALPNPTMLTYEQLIEKLRIDAAAYKKAEESKVKNRIASLSQNVKVEPAKPMSVEALENSLIHVLSERKGASDYHKYFNQADAVKKVKFWLRKYLPFMYKKEESLNPDAQECELLEESLALDQIKKVEVKADNFNDWLVPDLWKVASKDQQTAVRDLWMTHRASEDEQFPPDIDPRFRIDAAPGNVETKTEVNKSNISSNTAKDLQIPNTSNKTVKECEIELHNAKDAAKRAAWALYQTKVLNDAWKTDIRKDEKHVALHIAPMTYLDFDHFSEFQSLTPLSSRLIYKYCAGGRPISYETMKACITLIENISCRHAHCDLGEIVGDYSYGISTHTLGAYSTFTYYKCLTKCIFDTESMLTIFKILDPVAVTNIHKFNKDSSTQKSLKLDQSRLISTEECYFAKFKKWMRNTYARIKPTVSRAMKWLWLLLKWMLLLLVPLALVIGAVLVWKGWGTAKSDGDGSIKSTLVHLKPHIAEQTRQVYSSRGKSLFNPYEGMQTDAEGLYTIVPRQPGGSTIASQHIAKGNNDNVQAVMKLINDATTFLYVHGYDKNTGETTASSMRILRIGGQWILMPKHYITFVNTLKPDSISVNISLQDKLIDVNFHSFKYLNITDSEMIITVIPGLPRARDIRKHFCTEDDWMHKPVPSHMRIIEKKDKTVYVADISPKLIRHFTLTCFGDAMITIPDALRYEWAGEGRCMSVILDDQGKIRGVHIAGNASYGYGQIVTRNLLDELGDTQQPPVLPYLDPSGEPIVDIDTNVEHLGVVQAKYTVHQPTETNIRRSIIHGVFPVRTVPAPLKPCEANGYTEPLQLGVRKHGMPTRGFDAHDMFVAEQRFCELLLQQVKPIWSDVSVRSVDLAIRGVEGTPSFNSLVLSTSEGFPYVCERPSNQSSKRWLIHQHIDDEKNITYALHPKLTEQYDKNMELRKQNIIPPTVFIDCLKDARLPLEKAYTPGKVRIFSVAPTDFVIAFRQYFADFIVSYTKARFDMFHAIGIAPEKDDWSNLVHHLCEVGDKFLCGDYSNFGPGFDHAVHKAVYRSILRWYDEYSTTVDALQSQEERIIREIMQIELSEPIHIARNVLYKTYSGMCSGSPSTTPDNSMVNTFYILLAWYNIMCRHNPRLATLDAMFTHLRFVTYGDDIIMCVSDEVCEIFNNVSLSKFFENYGIKYTDALKTGEIKPYCSLAEATFLKRRFIPHPFKTGYFLGALDQVSVEDCANWINKTIDPDSASLEASYASLQLAYGWGPEYFSWVRDKLQKAWMKRKQLFLPRTWGDYERMYRDAGRVYVSSFIGEGQGPPTNTPGENTDCDQNKDTIIQDHGPADVDCPPSFSQRILNWAGADYDANYDRLVNRFVLVDQYPWSTTDTQGSTLYRTDGTKKIPSEIPLPLEIIKKNMNTPTILPFLQHKYFNGDMIIKVVVNVNKFMVGQLLVSFYYDAVNDAGYNFRNNIYNRSQMISGVVDAGASNTVELCLPYKAYRPWVHIGLDTNLGYHSQIGTLNISVLSQLRCPSNVMNYCHVSVYAAFKNASFMGVIPRDIVKFDEDKKSEGEMMPMLTTAAAAYLMQKFSDKNRDKPPVQLPGAMMQPQATSSMGIGTGASEPLQAMRLDARGQCPHPDAGDSDMNILNIAQKQALITSFKWKNDDARGHTLFSIDVNPSIPIDKLHKVKLREKTTSDPEINGYSVPPISVISGLFSLWRGSIEFTFSVVGSQYHTGRLLCCFLPDQNATITLEQAQALPYVVFDIHDERTFTFQTPYIADKPWWPCGYNNGSKDDTLGIGKIFVFVLNALIPMSSIAKEIDVLVYVKASPSFEVAVPRQPVWALPWNIELANPSYVQARDGYYPWYTSTWRYVAGGTKHVCRYGAVTDHIAQFPAMNQGAAGAKAEWFYYQLSKDDPHYETNKSLKIENTLLDEVIFVPIDVGDGYGCIYLGIGKQTDLSKIFNKTYTKGAKPDYTKLYQWSEDSSYVTGNPRLERKSYSATSLETMAYSSETGESENDVCAPTPSVVSTSCGLDTFGEQYHDAKDYLRRYEPMFRMTLSKAITGTFPRGKYQLSFDALPAGYDVTTHSPYAQASRDGGQAIVASGFRFFRGSMNFKIISDLSSVNIWVEHRPDRAYTSSSFRPAGQTVRDTHWAKNYAQVVAATHVNPTITINVPFYQPGALGLLQRPVPTAHESIRRMYSLGEILIGVDVPVDLKPVVQVDLEIFKSIGDDMRFYAYTGFPCLVFINDLIKK